MKRFIEDIKKKWISNKTKTILLILLLILFFILIYYILSKVNFPTFDLTESKLFTISNISKEKLQNLSYDVDIYFFGSNMSEDLSVYGIAQKYNKINNKIRTKVIIPNENPEFCEKFGLTSSVSAIIVASANDNYKILSMSNFYTTDYIDSSTIDLTEQQLTNAILDVQTKNKSNIYFLTGHSESTNLSYLKYYIENDINNILDLNISTNDNKVPDNCNCLVISEPKSDFSDTDVTAIINYINNGGNILWMGTKSSTFPNVQKILDLFGAKLIGEKVVESTYLYTLNGDLNTIIPLLNDHTITKYILTDGGLALFSPTSIDIVDDKQLENLGVTANVLVKSSNTSIFENLSESGAQEFTGDNGPYTIGCEFVKKINDNINSKLILIGDSSFVGDSVSISNQKTTGVSIASNKDLVLNTISYLTNHSNLVIRKSTPIITLTKSSDSTKLGLVVIIIFVIPILILVTGLIIWIIRRRKK